MPAYEDNVGLAAFVGSISLVLLLSRRRLRPANPQNSSFPSSPLPQSRLELAGKFDHTLLKADATPEDIERLCKEASNWRFASVCVNSSYVKLAKSILHACNNATTQIGVDCDSDDDEDDVLVCAVVGFPLGAASTKAKVAEALSSLDDGAREIDVVMNVGSLKGGLLEQVFADLKAVCDICHSRHAICKVILETCLLNDDEISLASSIALDAGADYIKTSTGFSTGGATQRAVEKMVSIARPRGKLVKASGGIRDGATASFFLSLGADRLGTSATITCIQDILNLTTSSSPSAVSSSY